MSRHHGLITRTKALELGASPSSIERDVDREAELTTLGWTVLRFSWRQVLFRTEWVVGTIAHILKGSEASRASR